MSESIDSRVVQMRFDNQQFEKGIQTSIRSLKQLDDSMDFESGEKSFHQLEKTVNDVKFDKIIAGLDAIASKFTFIGQLGMRLKNEVIDKLIDSGERMIKSLSVDQVSVGWDKYADKTSAVQTIMAATAKEFKDGGDQMGYVNDQLEKLAWFTDETSYNFLDMVSNIGKFTSAGIKLDNATTSMQGIAVWAAKSGANANEASRAMYNLSQSLGTGAVKLQDWMSIENANMATVEFKETAIETAAALGTLKKGADGVYKTMKGNEVTVANFREYLSDGWFTAEALTGTLNQYGAAVGELNKLYEDLEGSITTSSLIQYIDDYVAGTLDLDQAAKDMGMSVEDVKKRLDVFNTSTMQFSLKAFKAAQEAKTLAEALNSVKDAVSSKWMKSFELIFGDYEQAKKLWTNMANVLYDIFAASGDARNEMLELWAVMEKGGRDTLIDSLYAALSAILRLITPIKQGFQDIFPPLTAERLANFVDKLHDFLLSIQLTSDQMEKMRRIFRGVFSVVDILGTLIGQALTAGFDVLKTILEALNIDILETGANFGDMIYNFRNFVKSTNIFQQGANIIIKIFNRIVAAVKNFKASFSENYPEASKMFDGAVTAGKNALNEFNKLISAFKVTISHFIGKDADIELPKIKNFDDFKAALSKVKEVLEEELKEMGLDFSGFEKIFDALGDAGTGTLSMIGSALKLFGKIFDEVTSFVFSKLGVFNLMDIAVVALGIGMIVAINKIADSLIVFATAIKGFDAIGKSAKNMLDSLTGVFKQVQSNLKADRLKSIAISIGILTAALVVLAFIPKVQLLQALGIMAAAGVGILAFTAILKKIGKIDAQLGVLLAISSALAIMAITLNALNLENIIAKLGALSFMMMALVTTVGVLSKYGGQVQTGAITIIAIALSMRLAINALNALTQIDVKSITSHLPALIALLVMFGAFAKLAGSTAKNSGDGVKIFNSKATNLVAMALSMLIIIQAFKSLSEMDPADIVVGITSMISIFGAMSLLMIASQMAGEHANKAGTMLLAVSVALNLMVPAIKGLAKISADELGRATLSLTALMAFFALMTAASKLSGEHAGKAGLMFLEAAAAIAILTLVIKSLGQMETSEIIKGTGAVVALIAAFSLMVALSKSAEYAKKTITTVAVVIGLLSAIIIGLSFVDNEKMLSISGALSALMIAMGVLAKGIKDVQVSFKSAMVLSLVVGILGVVLTAMSMWANPEGIIPLAVGLGILLTSVAGSIKILSTIGGMGSRAADAALPVILKIGGILLALVTVFGIIDKFTEGGFADVINRAGPIMMGIGEAIGGLIGGFAGGLVAGGVDAILKQIPQWGTYLSEFSDNLTGFLTMLDSLGPDKAEAIGSLASMIATLGKSTIFKTPISEDQSENAKKAFVAIGLGIVGFSETIKNLTEDDVTKASSAVSIAKLLTELESNLPGENGKWQEWFGEKDLASFAEKLVPLGFAIVNFSSIVKDKVDEDSVKTAANAGQLISDLQKSLPSTGGVLQEWLGSKNLTSFGWSMLAFGSAIVAFSDKVTGADGGSKINSESVKAAADAGMLLSDLNKNLPATGGSLSNLLFGEKDLGKFADNIVALGEGIANFSEKVDGITEESVSGALGILNAFTGLDTSNTGGGGLFGALFGDDGSLKNLGAAITQMGSSLVVFRNKVANVDWNSCNKPIDILKEFATITDPAAPFAELLGNLQKMFDDTGKFIGSQEKNVKIKGETMFYWVAKGFESGQKKYQNIINKAAQKAAQNIPTVMENVLEIHSPSVVMNEIGHYVVKGLAEGIEEETSAEEAAKKKADNIVAAFNSIGERIKVAIELADLDYQLFAAMNPNATEEELNIVKRDALIEKLKYHAQNVQDAQAAWRAAQEELGNDSVETQKLYNEFMKQQIEMYQLKNEIMELSTGKTDTGKSEEEIAEVEAYIHQINQEALQEYNRIVKEEYAAWEEAGKSVEEFRKYAEEKSGWSQDLKDRLRAEFLPTEDISEEIKTLEQQLNDIINSALENVEVNILPDEVVKKTEEQGIKTGQAAGTGINQGLQSMTPQIEQTASGIGETIKTTIQEKVGQGWQMLQEILPKWGSEVSDVMPVADAYDAGVELMNNLKNGVESEIPELPSLGQKVADAFLNSSITAPRGDDRDAGALVEAGRSLIQQLTLGLQNGSPELLAAAQNIMNQCKTTMLSYQEGFFQAGQALGQKVAGGLQSKIAAVAEAAAAMVRAAMAAAAGAVSDGLGALGLGGGMVTGGMSRFGATPVVSSDWTASAADLPMTSSLVKASQTEQINSISGRVKKLEEDKQTYSTPKVISQDTTYNFNQTNNSPKALSSAEIYRQTNTQFARFKNVVSSSNINSLSRKGVTQ